MSLYTKKELAIKLRRLGFSYSEIQNKIGVPQSTLSGWLHDIWLSDKQKERLIKKGVDARKKGSRILYEERIAKTQKIIREAKAEISSIDNDALMLIGTTLYWAEGSKQSEGNNVSKEAAFSNSDPKMINVYLTWLNKCLHINKTRIVFEIYIHESHRKTVKELTSYWSKITGFSQSSFKKVYFKNNKIHTIRKNRGKGYSGVLRVRIKRSTDISRKIQGWIEGVCLRVAEMD